MLFAAKCFAQAGEWAWMHGSSLPNSSGNYGVQGIASVTNSPPGLYGPARWKDLEGNFWIFGGGTTVNVCSDLWKFDPSANMWTWIKGPGTLGQYSISGIVGIPSTSNNPGARSYGSACWTDQNGDLWLFGGNGNGIFPHVAIMLGDMWRYHISTNEWTWMAGNDNDLIHSGTFQVEAALNTPGQREECTANWTDNISGLWFYGGLSNGTGGSDRNDMWRYNINTNRWAWMSGDQTINTIPDFGVMNIFNATNTPGARMNYCGWQANGRFLLFGGSNSLTGKSYADLWLYDPIINQWSWISGSDSPYAVNNAGAKCDTSVSFYPAARWENRASWLDGCENLWLFGGTTNNMLNDLWTYNTSSKNWSWVSGSLLNFQSGIYGTMGVSNPANVPGARMGAVGWINNNGSLWLFGGVDPIAGHFYNDLWRFIPDSNCAGCVENFPASFIQASDSSVCEKYCISFFDSSSNNSTAWNWVFAGGSPSSSTDQNPANICYLVPGVYDVTLITTNANGSDTLTHYNYITVYSTPPFPTLSQVGYMLTSSSANSYQWQLNAVNIPGGTNQSYNVLQTGLYTVIVGDVNGCINSASKYVLISGFDEVDDESISIYPNPSTGNFIVEWFNGQMAGDVSIDVLNTIGQEIFSSQEKNLKANFSKTIDLRALPSGLYFLEVKSGEKFFRNKLVIAH